MKIKLKVIIIILSSVFSGLFAQTASIQGQVVDRFNKPLSDANIYLAGTILGSASDEGGNFIINRVPAGRFILRFSMIGYKQKDTTLTITTGVSIDLSQIFLEETALQSQPIVVTASKYEQNIQDIPLSISIVTAQEINYRNSTGHLWSGGILFKANQII